MKVLWIHWETLDIEGTPVRCLSPEDLLLLLCVHGTVHRWEELGWLSDIACLVSRFPKLDCDNVLEHSRRLYFERMVLLGLSLCRDLLGTEVPASVLKRLDANPNVRALNAKVKLGLWTEPASQWQRLVHYGLVAQTLSRFLDRLRF